MKRKIAAIFAADIAGYSRLVAEDEEETLRRLKAYRKVTDEFIVEAGGRIFNTAGDAVLAEFPSAVDAVRCAIDIQESLRTRNSAFPPSRQMSFRIGITIGDVHESDGDLLGEGVNIAARLEGLADVGGICVSRGVYEQVANRVSVPFTDMGAQPIKNMDPVHAYMVGNQTGDGKARKSGKSPRDFLATLFKRVDKHSEGSAAGQSWTARLGTACDRQTLQEALVVLLALVALSKVPDAATHAPAGMLTYVVIGLLSGMVVLVAIWLLDRRLQLGWTDRGKAAVAYGAICWLGPASIPILRYVGLGSYDAGYIASTELSFFLGCVGASAALWRKFRDRTVLAALMLIALLLVYRYAVFHSSVGTLSLIVIPLPVVLAGCLLTTPQSRVSSALDAATITLVWLIPFAMGLLLAAVSRLISFPTILQGDSLIYFFAMALPTALAWPAARLARPGFTWSTVSAPVIFDRNLKAGAIILTGIYVVAFATTSAERNTPFSRCASENGVDACNTVIDSLQTSTEDRINALEIRADRYMNDSKWDQAIADRTRLIELDPKNPERYTARAELWDKIDSYDQAIADFDAAVALQPNNPKLYLGRSSLWKEKGDATRALADLNQLVRLEPSAENFAKRAEFNVASDRAAAALNDYGMAIKLDPKNVSYLKSRADLLERKGEVDAARADYMSIIQLYDATIASAPTSEAAYERATLWRRLKDYQKALADYSLAIRLDPNDKYNFDSRAHLVQEMVDGAPQVMKYLDEFVSKEPTFADNYRIRAEYRDESAIDKNLTDYDQAIRIKPDDVDLRLARAALLEKKGNLAGAIADYDRAVQIDPRNAQALYRRGMAKSSRGDRTGAADIAAAKALDPDIAN